ncbi:MAG: YgiQ family radical SAM protein [Bacteroidales bacterium]|nr:YgiQ family radical SAM protein [Bacteroidales bacterium]MCF8405592.1 YgiQ family radical SAM protein [Bacteroidales bacterium]
MHTELKITDWLPITKKEAVQRGWDQLDVILISGDAYIDHPSFGPAVISRLLENMGLKVAIVPQPNWQDDLRDFKKFGVPRLFFGVTAGAMDSMVNHYTAHKRLRSTDAYTPGDRAGARPDYAATVYAKILKELFPDVPVVLGGVEASLRRFTHYDYWSDKLKPSILAETNADLLVYGMGEEAIKEIAREMLNGKKINELRDIKQTAYVASILPELPKEKAITLFSHEDCLNSKRKFASNFRYIEEESNRVTPKTLIQPFGEKYIVVNPTFPIPSEKQLDEVYDLPYTRMPHPKYRFKAPIPAYEMIKDSINMHRGCFGGCSFCTISAHQGKFIASRSEESILKEIEKMAAMPEFKGTISDLGGPSANMYKMKGIHQAICGSCKRPSCIFPKICPNLDTNHKPMTRIYKKALEVPGVKRAYVGSGIRYDMFVGRPEEEAKKNGYEEYTRQLIKHHVSGRLKVAPEHSSDKVLKIMRKPSFDLFVELKKKFDTINQEEGKNQQLIPYFISSHPACNVEDMADLAIKTKEQGYRLEQIQDFTPTPMTLATVMYYTGIDPYTGKKVYSANTLNKKRLQRTFFFWYKPENKKLIKDVLKKTRLFSQIKRLYG